MISYERCHELYNKIKDHGYPNQHSLKKAIILHDLTDSAYYQIESVLEDCNFNPSVRDVDRIECIAAGCRKLQEISQRQILALY